MAWKDACRRVMQGLPPLLMILAFVHPVARIFARWDWRLDLFSHFQEPALAVTLLAVVAMLWSRRRSVVVLLLLAAFQAEPVLRYSLANPVKPAGPDAPRLRILMANVLFDNENYEPLARLIRETDPDVVGLVEISDEWVAGLADVARAYPYRLSAPAGPRGLALWFKKPPIAIDPPTVLTPGGWPYLRATFEFAGRTRRLWLVHPASPMRRKGEQAGFPELAALAERIGVDGGSTIVMGDMNTTDGSPYFRDFARVAGLRDSRRGFGRQPSWPVGSPYQIAIDHAFLSDDLAVVDRIPGPWIGSDHRPFSLILAPSSSAWSTRVAADSASAR